MDGDIYSMINEVKAKLFTDSIERQAEIAQKLYGSQLKLFFTEKDIRNILDKDEVYDVATHKRVMDILCEQKRRYGIKGMERDNKAPKKSPR